MSPLLRNAFPLLLIAAVAAAFLWSISFEELPPAEFSFDNGNEVQTIDPARATGQPENRIINALFEGLLRTMPEAGWEERYEPTDNVPMVPQPGMAELPEVSADGRVYTFRIRPNMQWSDGSPVTSHDFAWSWMRTLHPDTASKYSYQLYYIKGGQAYNTSQLALNEPVEVELANRKDPLQLFPRGDLVRGQLQEILKPPSPKIPKDASEEIKGRIEAAWMDEWVYRVDVAEGDEAESGQSVVRAFARDPAKAKRLHDGKIEKCLYVLPDFEKTVGVSTPDDRTLIVTLNASTPYFNELAAFYTLYPVNRRSVIEHGTPGWTKPENLVSNGPYTMQFRRIRDRIRLQKNSRYWNAKDVKLNVIDAFAVKSETTTLNMYLNDQIEWATVMPVALIPQLKREMPDQFSSAPMLTVYFYRVNVTRPGLDDVRVRKALNLAIDKANICQIVTRAGEVPATTYVPPGLAGYKSPPGLAYDVDEAQRLLTEAGYPNGRGLPPVEILYNDLDAHRTIAERIQQMWRENLGVDARLRGLEWGVYLTAQDQLDYGISRAGWIADYPDPNTFLDMFTSENTQNQTGWKNEQYDKLIAGAATEADPEKRLEMLSQAEAILLDEMPILPLYFYVSKNLIKPQIKGFFNNVQDMHPLTLLSNDKAENSPTPAATTTAPATAGGAR